jgi:hypothetical protein
MREEDGPPLLFILFSGGAHPFFLPGSFFNEIINAAEKRRLLFLSQEQKQSARERLISRRTREKRRALISFIYTQIHPV